MVHVEIGPAARAQSRPHLLEVGGARQRSQNGEAGLIQLVSLDEFPEIPEIVLVPRWIDHEVPGHPIPEASGHIDPVCRLIDRGVLHQPVEPGVGGGFEPKENVELPSQRSPRLEETRVPRDQIHAALDENPALANASAGEFPGELETARGMVPKEIVRDEYVVADFGDVPANRVNRTFPYCARVELPDRTERTSKRTPPSSFHQRHGTVREARIPATPRLHVLTIRQRYRVE